MITTHAKVNNNIMVQDRGQTIIYNGSRSGSSIMVQDRGRVYTLEVCIPIRDVNMVNIQNLEHA